MYAVYAEHARCQQHLPIRQCCLSGDCRVIYFPLRGSWRHDE